MGQFDFRLAVFLNMAQFFGHYRTSMKKYVILGLAILLGTVPNMRGQPAKLSDQEIQKELTGTWVTTWGNDQTTTNIIAADGSYVSLIKGPKGGARYTGTFQATNGMVLGKAWFGKQAITLHLHIIQLDSHELVWSNENAAAPSTFHKVEK
jgi:hypothetical protein